jgi:FMN phosphatase YigB (HAD superfamily)
MRAIVCDPEGVLYDATLWRRWVWRQLNQMGCVWQYAALWHGWDSWFAGEVDAGRIPWPAALREFLRLAGLSKGAIEEVVAAGEPLRMSLAREIRPLPGVAMALARAQRAGLTLAVLCDTDLPGTVYQGQLERMGLAQHFEAVVTSSDIGAAKPQAAAYEAVLAELGVAPADAAFVSREAADLRGAAACGLLTIGVLATPGAADRHIARLDDLLSVLAAPALRAAA